jgi:hypothetical protein
VSGKWFNGKGRIASEKTLVERARDALQQKHGWQMWRAKLPIVLD